MMMTSTSCSTSSASVVPVTLATNRRSDLNAPQERFERLAVAALCAQDPLHLLNLRRHAGRDRRGTRRPEGSKAARSPVTSTYAVPMDRVVLAPDERRDLLIDTLNRARSRIRLSLFRCTDRRIYAALAAAVDRGVDVQVIVTSRAKGGRKKVQKLWSRLEKTGARVHPYNDAVVKYHAKYLVVDDGPALVATLNFTRKSSSSTCDAIVETWDPAVVNGLLALMDADVNERPAPETLPDRLIVGPERARRQFTSLLSGARTRIRIIDAKLSDPDLVSLLNERRAAGVSVDIYRSKRIAGAKSHGKIMLLDDTTAIVGSLSLKALSLDFRREVAIVCREPQAVERIRELFEAVGQPEPAADVARRPSAEADRPFS
jgi:phosphatidylserine/phosphatidylglycerophosphate/cardiolipin synthase-like enzyme